MTSRTMRALVALILMLAAACAAYALTPTRKLSDRDPVLLDSAIPSVFGDWIQEAVSPRVVVNPQQADLINRLYSQLVTRSYVNTKTGSRVMLSVAYGEDQRDSTQMHYPEVCYPAQGFVLKTNTTGVMHLKTGVVRVRRLETVQGEARHEPVTYWTMIGYTAVLGGLEKKLVEMQYGLRGTVPDGLLFRVSTIDNDSASGFAIQKAFVDDLLSAVSAASRHRLAGV